MFKKSINKIILILALSCGLSNITNAAVSGPYIGGQYGEGSTDYNAFDDNDSGPAGRIFAGYQFNPYFATELGYLQFSKTYDDFSSGTFTENSVDLLLKGMLPLGEKFNLYGKLGGAYVTVDTNYVANSSFYTGQTYHELEPAGAIGFSYDITPNLPIDFSYMHIQALDNSKLTSSEFFSVGLSYHFDR